jgi:hypothetical protein
MGFPCAKHQSRTACAVVKSLVLDIWNVFVLLVSPPLQASSQLLQLYVFSLSLVVSYHIIHSVGELGAVELTIGSFIVTLPLHTKLLLFIVFIF